MRERLDGRVGVQNGLSLALVLGEAVVRGGGVGSLFSGGSAVVRSALKPSAGGHTRHERRDAPSTEYGLRIPSDLQVHVHSLVVDTAKLTCHLIVYQLFAPVPGNRGRRSATARRGQPGEGVELAVKLTSEQRVVALAGARP